MNVFKRIDLLSKSFRYVRDRSVVKCKKHTCKIGLHFILGYVKFNKCTGEKRKEIGVEWYIYILYTGIKKIFYYILTFFKGKYRYSFSNYFIRQPKFS